jgi:hypothetical protein
MKYLKTYHQLNEEKELDPFEKFYNGKSFSTLIDDFLEYLQEVNPNFEVEDRGPVMMMGEDSDGRR